MTGASQVQDRPRFRQDLVAEAFDDEQGARFIDVADPDSGSMFRFYEVEYSLACAMDGERDVPGIVKWAQEELGLTPSPAEIRRVIATLGELGFIELGAEARDSAMGELARGVVVGARAPAAAASSNDFELGHPASFAPPAAAALPKAPQLDLGAPGTPAVQRPAVAPVEDIPLGRPGRFDTEVTLASPPPSAAVSLDLSDHIAVRPDDVKEAVRASKVINAVDVPKELLEAIEPVVQKPVEKPIEKPVEKPAAKASAVAFDKTMLAAPTPTPKAAPAATKPVEPAKPAAPAAKAEAAKPAPTKAAEAAKPSAKSADKPAAAKAPVELPKQPAAAAAKEPPKKIPEAPVEKSGVSGFLIAALVLAVLGAGGFAVWKFVLDKPDTPTTPPPAPTAETPPPAPAPAQPPPPPGAKIVMEAPPADDIKALTAGQVETIESDKDVKSGDVIARLVGHKPIEAALTALAADEKRVQGEVDQALKERDAAGANKSAAAEAHLADRQRSLETKKAADTAKRAELERLVLKATNDGKVSAIAKAGQTVKAEDVLAKLTRPPAPVATFKVANVHAAVDTAISITANGKPVTCTVAALAADSLKVACPGDAGLAEGTDVTVTLPR